MPRLPTPVKRKENRALEPNSLHPASVRPPSARAEGELGLAPRGHHRAHGGVRAGLPGLGAGGLGERRGAPDRRHGRVHAAQPAVRDSLPWRRAEASAGSGDPPGGAPVRAGVALGVPRQLHQPRIHHRAGGGAAGLVGRRVLPERQRPDAGRPDVLPDVGPGPDGAVQVCARCRRGAGGRRGHDLVLQRPAHLGHSRQRPDRQRSWPSPIRWRVCW